MLSTNILFSLNTVMIMVATNIITITMTIIMTATIAKNMITNVNILNDDCCYGKKYDYKYEYFLKL